MKALARGGFSTGSGAKDVEIRTPVFGMLPCKTYQLPYGVGGVEEILLFAYCNVAESLDTRQSKTVSVELGEQPTASAKS